MKYIRVNSEEDLRQLESQLENENLFLPQYDCKFLREQGMFIYGYFIDENSAVHLIDYGITVLADNTPNLPETSIFAKLRKYGSSKKYHGLVDVNGFVKVQPIYEGFDILQDFNIIICNKNGKYGLLSEEGRKLTDICFDNIFNAGENTIGFVENGKVGFMTSECKVVINPQYEHQLDDQNHDANFNYFINGFAFVIKKDEFYLYRYIIDHYGIMVKEAEPLRYNFDDDNYSYDEEDRAEHNLGTGYYPYGELPDSSDAYEGDDSNRWNTD